MKDEQKNPIQVVERMMKLLEVLEKHPEPLGLKQISQYTGLHPSTAHRILSAMSADRLVDRVEPGSYRLGMRLLELGNLVKSRISVRELALPLMRELHAHTGETANLSVRHDDQIVYVERTSSAHARRCTSPRPGSSSCSKKASRACATTRSAPGSRRTRGIR
jgi:DNA-binding IclR family transcriptional regulator